MKKLVTLLLVLVMVLSIAVFASAEELPRVAFICKGYSDTYCYLVGTILVDYAETTYADQFTLDMFDGEVDNAVINNLIETCVADGYNAIILQQNDPDAPVPVIKAAVEAGVYVIVTTGSVNDDGESYYIDADPVQQGSLLVDYAVAQGMVVEGTNVALLRGIDGTFHADGRHQGYVDGLTAAGANIVDDQTANWKTSEALPIVEAWLVSNPEIECIFAANDDMALGAITAMENAGRDDIKVFSVDANELGCVALMQGKLTASVAQNTKGYAQTAVDYAATLLSGGTVESVRLDSTLVLAEDAPAVLLDIHGYTEDQVAAING